MNYDWLNSSAIAIVGARGSGKTAMAYYLLDKEKTRPVYAFKCPKPELINDRGWHNMSRLEELYDLNNSVVWLDEPQLTIPRLDKRANEGLQKVLSIARHRDITMMFSTCDTRWVTRALESYVDVWLVKDVETRLVKQGSMVSKIVKAASIVDPDEFRLAPDEYLSYARNFPDVDGRHKFTMPVWFTDEHSKPYATETAPELRATA